MTDTGPMTPNRSAPAVAPDDLADVAVAGVEVFDVAVVGAGPAGLAAAVTCARAGLGVVLLDRGTSIGGQYWRQPPGSGRSAPRGSVPGRRPVDSADLRHLHHDLATFEALRDRLGEAVDAGLVDLRLRTQVWTAVLTGERPSRDEGSGRGDGEGAPPTSAAAEPTVDLHVVGPGPRSSGPTGSGAAGSGTAGSAAVVRARRVVLATGAHDIALPFPGWDLPGVMTIGGLQALLKGSDVLPGRRIVLGGTGPFLLPVAAGLATRGAEVVGVFEANAPTGWLPHLATVVRHPARMGEGLAYAATLARRRVPVRPRTMIVEGHGSDRVEAVSVRRLDRAGRLRPGAAVRLEVDAVGVGWGFSPILDLAVTLGCVTVRGDHGLAVVAADPEQRTSVPGVLVAGELTGVGGASLSVAEGELAGHVVVGDLTGRAASFASAGADGTRAGTARCDVADGAATGREVARSATIPRDVVRRGVVEREVVRLRAFAAAMHAAHPIPAGWADTLRPDTVVCRCEEVEAGAVRAAVASGADTARQVKQLTRAGMGWCQGRVCEPACALLASGDDRHGGDAREAGKDRATRGSEVTGRDAGPLAGDTERLVAQPVSLGALADSIPATPQKPVTYY